MNKQAIWGSMTRLLHSGREEIPCPAVSAPIYQSATYRFDRPEEIAEAMTAQAHPQFYGRYSSPNNKQVEAMLAALAGGEGALVVGSGMAAISLVLLTFLRAGDHVVAQKTHYPPTTKLISHQLAEFGISHTLVEQTDTAAFAAAIRPETRLIYVESPANPTLALTDLAAIAELGRAHGALTVADNTFATPHNQRPLSLGIDLELHSATKYLGGHSDVVAGAIIGREEHLEPLWHGHVMHGAVLHPFESWLLQRGLQTFPLRMARHNENGLAVAQFLQQHPTVSQVHYPGLPSHPQHELARQQMTGGYGGMVCFELRGGRTAGYNLLQNVRLISLAVSLGGTHSLISHPASTISQVQSDEEIAASGVRPGLVRLSVGLEDAADIITDLTQALEAL